MSMMLMVEAFKIKLGCSTRKLILLKLADNANDDGWCWPSYNHIADMCEIDKRTAQRHVKKLEEDGYLIIKKRLGPKGNSSNLYHLTLGKYRGDNLSPPLNQINHNTLPPKELEGAADDHHMAADDPLHGGTGSPESVIEPVNEPKEIKTSSSTDEHDGLKVAHTEIEFTRLWLAWPNAKNRKRSVRDFKKVCRGKALKDITVLTNSFINDVQARLKANQLGFSNMMLSTYLNNERWHDDITGPETIKINSSDEQKAINDKAARAMEDSRKRFKL